MDTKNKPLKRDKSLQPLSRDHHHGLLLCWKIRTGLKNGVVVQRIKDYSDWFFQNHLDEHFNDEEQYLFPLLGETNELVKKAMSEHRRLRRLFNDEQDIEKSLSLIEEELDAHIRFEERILFNEIQMVANPEELRLVNEKIHTEVKDPDEDWNDHFWKK